MTKGWDVPNWVMAAVAVLAFGGSTAGLYTGLSSKMDVFSSEFTTVKRDVQSLDDYQGYLQEQIDAMKDRITRLEVRLEYANGDREDLKKLLRELNEQLDDMNEVLLRGELK